MGVILLCLGDNSSIGCIGQDPFNAMTSGVGIILSTQGIVVQVTRHSPAAQSSIYGEPLDPPTQFDARVVVTQQELDEVETIGGGKRNEVLAMFGLPGTLLENDVVSYAGRLYDVRLVNHRTIEGALVVETYTAYSQVDV